MSHRDRDSTGPGSEEELVELLRSVLGDPGERIRTPLGDDAAVIVTSSGTDLVFTTDSYVRGIHFPADRGSFCEIGHRAMGGALSDIAAMGARPVAALVSIGLPAVPDSSDFESLYKGLNQCARRNGCTVVGGETVRTEKDFVITIGVLGEVKKDTALTRSGAKMGDLIYVSGQLGRGRAALRCLETGCGGESMLKNMHDVFFEPRPRIAEAEYIKDNINVTSMIDISDGLSTDLHHIAAESGVGAVVFEGMLPVAKEAREVSKVLGEDPIEYVLDGGEDYELLFTVHTEVDDSIQKQFNSRFDLEVTFIGEVLESGVYIEKPDRVRNFLVPGGFDHLKRSS
jgi:thiamine-monophosphate kinase